MLEVRDYPSRNRATFVCLNLGMALITLNAYGAVSWIPAMFARRHGWRPEDAGFVFGLIVAFGGMSGGVAGGRLAAWLNERGHGDANVRVALLRAAGWLPFGIAF